MIVKNKEDIPAWVFQELSHHNIQLNARKCQSAADFWETASDAEIIWMAGANRFITPEVLPRLAQCGAILRTGSGVNDIPVDAATQQGIIIATTPDAIAESVAEHTVALLLASVRRIPEQDRGTRSKIWNEGTFRPMHHLKGSTLGLISFGRIARRVAEMLSGFHLEILAYDPLLPDEFIQKYNVEPCSLKVLLQRSDFVSIHCPLNDKTRHLISEKELHLMKPNAILLNTARGAIIDEKALIKVLQQGDIAAAALDVLEEEPPQQDNPLLKMDNVILTPHIAAFSDQFEENYWKYSIETIIDLSRKRWPPSVVNPQLTPKWKMKNR